MVSSSSEGKKPISDVRRTYKHPDPASSLTARPSQEKPVLHWGTDACFPLMSINSKSWLPQSLKSGSLRITSPISFLISSSVHYSRQQPTNNDISIGSGEFIWGVFSHILKDNQLLLKCGTAYSPLFTFRKSITNSFSLRLPSDLS